MENVGRIVSADPIVSVENLSIEFETASGTLRAADGIDLSLGRGRVLGIVGESGSGKSVVAKAVLRLLASNGNIRSGRILYNGRDLLELPAAQMRAIRGNEIAMVFQDAMVAFNPVLTIGDQIVEVMRQHKPIGRSAARQRVIDLLGLTGIRDPATVAGSYPREFSGGMLQRAVIAMALSCEPRVLIADEPTTALDSAVRMEIIRLLHRLGRDLDMSVVMISHDLGVIAEIADDIAIMYAGRVVEFGPAARVLAMPKHPYTAGLIASIPTMSGPRRRLRAIPGNPPDMTKPMEGCPFAPRCPRRIDICDERPALAGPTPDWRVACWRAEWSATAPAVPAGEPSDLVRRPPAAGERPLLAVEGLTVEFGRRSIFSFAQTPPKVAVDDVSFSVRKGETLAIVGESGSGKTTLGRAIMRLIPTRKGSVRLDGADLTAASPHELLALRRRMQMIFQDPYGSLNPKLSVAEIVAEPLVSHGIANGRQADDLVAETLKVVGILPDHRRRYPKEFSGGQRQRINIARALVLKPDLLVADEPTSALDVSIQAQIVDLLGELQRQFQLTFLFISHDLALVRYLSDRVAVLYRSRIVEIAAVDELFDAPRHPYTAFLLQSAPSLEGKGSRKLKAPAGFDPASAGSTQGCAFALSCPFALPACHTQPQTLAAAGGTRAVACMRWPEIGHAVARSGGGGDA